MLQNGHRASRIGAENDKTGLRDLPYIERLKYLQLHSLEENSLRGDLTVVFRIKMLGPEVMGTS